MAALLEKTELLLSTGLYWNNVMTLPGPIRTPRIKFYDNYDWKEKAAMATRKEAFSIDTTNIH